MIILGVTGSIGSGKSYFCKALARNKGVRLLSSDAEVHRLYACNKELLAQISKHFPKAVVGGKIDRKILGEIVFKDLEKKQLLENIVYPLLKKNRHRFLKDCVRRKTKLVVFEIPLLFENDLDIECDYTLTVFCSPILEKKRVLRRTGMTEDKFNKVMATQIPTAEKVKYSDYHFNSGRGKEFSARAAKKIYLELVG
jgi:dephospho-CoA kinase